MARMYFEEPDVICRECGTWFCPGIDERRYNDLFQYERHQGRKYRYRLRYPDRDICFDCAVEETEMSDY